MALRLLSGTVLTIVLATGAVVPAVADVINGTNGSDVLTGTAGPDTIRGYKGADVLYGKGSADRLYGGADNRRDRLYGGRGPDHIFARGRDFVYAGRGNDTIRVSHLNPWTQGGRHTRVYCGPGEDTVIGPVNWFSKYGCEHVINVD